MLIREIERKGEREIDIERIEREKKDRKMEKRR